MAGTVLRTAAQHDIRDYFEFSIERTHLLDDVDVGGAVRFNVGSNLANRQWTNFKLDVGVSQPVLVGEPDTLSGPALLLFSGIDPIVVLALPLAQHVAEKLHAYTRTYGPQNRSSSRVKDLVDLVLIQQHERLSSEQLRTALNAVFTLRETPPIPARLPLPPESWRSPY